MENRLWSADAGYKTPAVAQYIFENDMTPALPYTRPRTKDGYFKNMSMFTMNTTIVIFVR